MISVLIKMYRSMTAIVGMRVLILNVISLFAGMGLRNASGNAGLYYFFIPFFMILIIIPLILVNLFPHFE